MYGIIHTTPFQHTSSNIFVWRQSRDIKDEGDTAILCNSSPCLEIKWIKCFCVLKRYFNEIWNIPVVFRNRLNMIHNIRKWQSHNCIWSPMTVFFVINNPLWQALREQPVEKKWHPAHLWRKLSRHKQSCSKADINRMPELFQPPKRPKHVNGFCTSFKWRVNLF